MKKTILLLMFVFVLTGLAVAQPPADPPPSRPATPVVRDDALRMRSVEIERARRDAQKINPDTDEPQAVMKTDLDKKFPEINEDFNGLQTSYQAIVKAYENTTKTDHKVIESSAKLMKKHAKRLNSNLFDSKLKPKKDKKEKEELSIRDLIIKLDKAVVGFTRSKMFTNLRVVDPMIAGKAQMNLFDVMQISDKLAQKAGKMK